ncbi:hypothetical protein IMG5_088880 [Ichthyophthirius multifiliis]|uniref:Uncharacterized protein n=1 Tax=Ichthyophthirius multifiliis TaxID=5932 RepID=G0QR52_ICHMU|nr:hypothetical protein IMG5_088880 [Ichthyophthirius multifiliis]EGR32304.1 hypothetical protein IMG5_088880 [Ichthyophthirius multifiliis]|eukprot:XP_004035790.1 hypothetical protein IMG5_088880 [Ichthyophthirius multifiliis]
MNIFDRKEFKFILGVGGIYVSYIYYGLTQEKMLQKQKLFNIQQTNKNISFSTKYKSNIIQEQTRFNQPWALLFLQCLFSFIVAFLVNIIYYDQSKKIPISYQIQYGFYNAFSMLGSNTALKYMSYPLQALFKSCKVLSVLIVGLIFGKTNHQISQYLCGFIVTIGIVGFNLQEQKSGNSKQTSLFGIALILGSLFSDGMLAEKQDMTRKLYNPSSWYLMQITSMWCSIFSILYALIFNQFWSFIEFCQNYREGFIDILSISFMGCIGQVFIFYTIKNFGPFLLALVTTTRKFFTVLCSIVYFGHVLNGYQWACVGLVLVGVSIELIESYKKKKATSKKN